MASSSNGQRAVDDVDFVHVGPDTLNGQFLRRFWHPVYRAEDLAPGRAVAIRALGEDMTLYRGRDGRPHTVAARCAHRATMLSVGVVEDDCIRCSYHGWKYDATGQCVDQPAEDAAFARKVRIRGYPTEQYAGLVFVFQGEGLPPPLPRYRELEQPGVLETTTYSRACNYFQAVENNFDPTHVGAAHPQVPFGELPRISVEESDWGITLWQTRTDKLRRDELGMPNVFHFKLPARDLGVSDITGLAPLYQFHDTFAWRVPIDDTHHMSFNANLIPLTGDAVDEYRRREEQRLEKLAELPSHTDVAESVLRGQFGYEEIRRVLAIDPNDDMVNAQDDVVQMGQGAITDRSQEQLGRADVGIILLRKIWTRELRALAAGEPLKQWVKSEALVPTVGV